MRTVELAKVAAAAEALRLRRIARRQGLRAAFGVAAAVFALAILVVLHVVLWQMLRRWVTPIQATLVLLGADVVITAVFAFMAMRDVPDSIEVEAKRIRTQALRELRSSLTVMAMAAEIAGLAVRAGGRSGGRGGLSNTLAEVFSRLIGR